MLSHSEYIYIFPGGAVRTDNKIREYLLPLLDSGRIRILQTRREDMNGLTGQLRSDGSAIPLPRFAQPVDAEPTRTGSFSQKPTEKE